MGTIAQGFMARLGSDFPGGSDGKSVCLPGDPGLIPGSGRSLGEENGNPLQYSCLENPMDRETCRLQSMGSQRVRHNWATSLSFFLWKCHIWSHWPERSCTPSTRVWVRLENVVFLFVQEKEVGWAGISLWHTHCIRQVSCSKQMAHLTGILNLMEVLFYRGVNGVKRIFEGFWHIQGLAKTGSLYLPCLWGL